MSTSDICIPALNESFAGMGVLQSNKPLKSSMEMLNINPDITPLSPPPLYSKATILNPMELSNIGSGSEPYANAIALIAPSFQTEDPLDILISQDYDIGFKFFCERLKVNLSSCKVNLTI